MSPESPRTDPSAATIGADAAGRSGVVACPHADVCPGCALIGLDEAQQLDRKTTRVRDAFARFSETTAATFSPIVPATPRTEYRERAKLAADREGHIGLYARGAHHAVVDLPGCRVLVPAVRDTVQKLRGETLRGASVRAVDVRRVTTPDGPKTMLTVVTTRDDDAHVSALETRLARAGVVVDVFATSFHDGKSPQLLGKSPRVHRGPAALTEALGNGARHFVPPGSFAQAHPGQASRIRAEITRGLRASRAERILELYAGTAPLGLSLAEDGFEVTAVESFAPAAELANRAAQEQRLTRFRALARDAATLRDEGHRYDAVVANPPRRGLDPEVRHMLARLAPRNVAYVSCDPETLARDLSHLLRSGFALTRVTPFDMIPLTAEVETLAWLESGPVPPPRVLYEDESLIAVLKPPHEPTTPQGEYVRALLDRVRLLPDAAAAIPIHRLDEGTSGVCLFARRAELVAPWSAALSSDTAQKRYLALVRGRTHAKGIIDRPLRDEGKNRQAKTRYKRLAVHGGHTLVEARPAEGRTHQIRRHFAAIGHPLLGDARYGDVRSNRHVRERATLDRAFLHCASITLVHPHTGLPLKLEAELAPDLQLVLDRLGRTSGDALTP